MSRIAVIGAGMGGLTAGNLLAKKGHEVILFEAHSTPGGYTAGFWRKGYYFERGTLSFEMSDAVFSAMKEIGVYDKIPFTRQITRWVSRDYDFVMHSIDDMKKAIREAFPSEKERLDRYYADIDRMCGKFRALNRSKGLLRKVAFPYHFLRFMNMVREYGRMTSSEFAGKYFEKNSKLYFTFRDVGYPDMSALVVPAAYMSFIEDYWTVKTGMQSWSDVLAENFKRFGGELRLKSKVDRIITKNGSAVGVSCNGKNYDADYVLSASDYKKTFLKLLDDKTLLPNNFRERVEKAPVSESFFVVYLGLNMPKDKLLEYMKVPHVLYGDCTPPGPDISDSNDDIYFDKVWIGLYSPSLLHDGLAPKDKSSLMLNCMVPFRWMNNWGNGDRKIYEQLKEKTTKLLIKRVSTIIPGIEKHIEFCDAATPLTYERYTSNTDGASSAWSWNPNKWFYKNPSVTKIDTPVKNLYISSCWAYEFGGVPTAIGAAQLCAKRIK